MTEVGVMPKELIASKHSHDEESTLLRVGWTKGQSHVEVATIAPDGMQLEPTAEGNGWFIQLDADGIDQALRVLRRAKRQAFNRLP